MRAWQQTLFVVGGNESLATDVVAVRFLILLTLGNINGKEVGWGAGVGGGEERKGQGG